MQLMEELRGIELTRLERENFLLRLPGWIESQDAKKICDVIADHPNILGARITTAPIAEAIGETGIPRGTQVIVRFITPRVSDKTVASVVREIARKSPCIERRLHEVTPRPILAPVY